MSYSTQTLFPNKDNVENILNLPSTLTDDDKHRYEGEVKSLATTPDFKELHLLINENKIVGFLALKGALPCSVINHLALETAYVLIQNAHRGQRLSSILISKYLETINRWTFAALNTSYTESYQELIFNLQINDISNSGTSFRKKSVKAALEWCINHIQPRLNDHKINTFDTPYIIFYYGYGNNHVIFSKTDDYKIFEPTPTEIMSDKPLYEVAYNI